MRGLLEEILSPEKPGLDPLPAPVGQVLSSPTLATMESGGATQFYQHLASVAEGIEASAKYKDRACANLDKLAAEMAELSKAFMENMDAARQNLLLIRSLVSQIHC